MRKLIVVSILQFPTFARLSFGYKNAHLKYNIFTQIEECILNQKMIVFKKMGLLGPFLSTAAAMRFSVEPKRQQLSLNAQKAVWATSIIKTIANAAPPSTIKDSSLRDVILNLPDPSAQFYFEKSEKDKVTSLFKEGIYLAPPFLAQSRVAQAQQEMKQNQSLKKFIFFPNRSVTTPMFQQLLRYSEYVPYSLLLTGEFGTSKTVSIILFIHLSYHQTLYAYEALKDVEKEKEYSKLIQMKLIPKAVPKYWYWSAYYDQDIPIIKLLLAQAIEIEQNIKDQLQKETSLSQFITKLGRLYPQPIISRPIVDQINFIASALREQNQHHQTHNPHSIISRNSDAAKYLSLLKKLLLLGNRFTLNSSMTIQIDLLQKSRNNKLTFDFHSPHKNFSITHIPYEKSIATKEGHIDFWQTFWFEMERRMKHHSKTQAEIAAAKQTFYKSASSVKVSNLSSFNKFIYVRTFLTTSYPSLLKALSQQSDQLIKAQLQNFTYHCIEDSYKSLRLYCSKGNTKQKRKILYNILLRAYLIQDNEKLWTSQFKLTKRQMEKIFFGPLQQYEIFTRQTQNRNFSEQQAFTGLKPFLKNWSDDIQFIYTASQLNTLIYPLLLQDVTDKGITDTMMKAMIKSKSGTGSCIQIFLRECLSSSGWMDLKATSKSSKEEVFLSFKIIKTVAFRPMNDQKQPSSIQNFEQALLFAIDNPDEDILALPYVIVNGKRMRYADYSATIDFLIVRYNKMAKKLYIWSFDTTLAGKLKEKINKARDLLGKLISNQSAFFDSGIDIEMKHAILMTDSAQIPKEKISNKKIKQSDGVDQENDEGKDKPKVNIYFVLLEKLRVSSSDLLALQYFKTLLDVNKSVSEQKTISRQMETEETIDDDLEKAQFMALFYKKKFQQEQKKIQKLLKGSKNTK